MHETTRAHQTSDQDAPVGDARTTTTDARRRLRRLATLAAAITLPLVVWVVAVPGLGLDLAIGSGVQAQTVGPAAIGTVALIAGAAAWAVLALLERFARRGARIFTILGWTLLALSLLGPATTGAAAPVVLTLVAMHLATGATLMVGLPRSSARRSAVAADAVAGR
ncbi:DUF6069 family protein [Agromyces sp. G08B096]|uniref:DUF6069 family protein n=1 Tax=Agromyces sp. G08B096 TaxID=3156399 RepID=A0AAU7W2S0_9MICO